MKSNISILKNKIRGKIRSILYDFQVFIHGGDNVESGNTSIDVIIPAIEKNLSSLPVCIQGIRSCVMEKVKNIYIVAPDTTAFREFCEKEKVTFVDENLVLGYSARDINLITDSGLNRSGWMFQQFLKLAGNIGTEENFLVCDADHILITPHTFIMPDNKYVFYQSQERHSPYYANIKKLIGLKKLSCLSYVDHKMIFNKSILATLKKEIEEKNNQPWDKAICGSIDKSTDSPFSEYELYGNYVQRNMKIKRPWLNKDLENNEICTYEELQEKYSSQYRTVTFPYSYNNLKND